MSYTQGQRSSIEMNSSGAENPPESPSEKIFLKNLKNYFRKLCQNRTFHSG